MFTGISKTHHYLLVEYFMFVQAVLGLYILAHTHCPCRKTSNGAKSNFFKVASSKTGDFKKARILLFVYIKLYNNVLLDIELSICCFW